jgi:hypothetical protein
VILEDGLFGLALFIAAAIIVTAVSFGLELSGWWRPDGKE